MSECGHGIDGTKEPLRFAKHLFEEHQEHALINYEAMEADVREAVLNDDLVMAVCLLEYFGDDLLELIAKFKALAVWHLGPQGVAKRLTEIETDAERSN